jgi:hypothetical protein
MKYSIGKYNKDYTISSINNSIINILRNNQDILKFPLNDLIVCYKFNEEISVLFKYHECEYCIILEADIFESFVFFVVNFFSLKNISFSSVFKILDIADSLGMNIELFNKLLVFFNLPVYKKGFDYFNSYKSMSDLLKKRLDEKKISLKDAVFFHNHFKKDYDAFLSIIPTDLSFASTSEFIRNITEYSLKKGKNIKNLLEDFSTIKKTDIVNKSRLLRFPLYSKYFNKFEKFIDNLKLPKGVKVSYDERFESQRYTLTVDFTSLKSLDKKIDDIKNIMDSFKGKNDKDLFIYENLFKDDPE